MPRLYSLVAGLAISVALFSALPSLADTTINDGAPTDAWGPLCRNNYGVVFTAPAHDVVLTDYTLYAHAQPYYPGFQIRTDVLAWNGANATGPVLYQSGVFTIAASNNQDFTTGYTDLTSSTGGLTLTAGQQYIVIASTAPDLDATAYGTLGVSSASIGGNNYGVYAQANTGNSTSDFSTSPWYQLPSTPAFLAHFGASPVPEPSGAAAAAIGFVILGMVTISASRRRNRVS